MYVRFCLLYGPFKWDFIAFKTNIISLRKRFVDMDVVNDVTCTRQSVITRVVIVYDFYDTTLSTDLQRRHMINSYKELVSDKLILCYTVTHRPPPPPPPPPPPHTHTPHKPTCSERTLHKEQSGLSALCL